MSRARLAASVADVVGASRGCGQRGLPLPASLRRLQMIQPTFMSRSPVRRGVDMCRS